MVLRRKLRGRVRLTNHDRWFLIQLYRWVPSILEVLTIIQPETLVRWHRAGFRCYRRWKSRRRGGRPQIEMELRGLIRQMCAAYPWPAAQARVSSRAVECCEVLGFSLESSTSAACHPCVAASGQRGRSSTSALGSQPRHASTAQPQPRCCR